MLVLETDDPHPETQERRGSFAAVFDDLFSTAGSKHDLPLSVDVAMHFCVEDPENGKYGHAPELSDVTSDTDAILINGSMYDAHGNDAWILKLLDFLREVWDQKPNMRFSGVWFGHQLLSRLLGAKVESTPGGKWELAHTTMDLTPIGRRLVTGMTEDQPLELHQMHQDQVTSVPSNATTAMLSPETKVHVWASTDHTPI